MKVFRFQVHHEILMSSRKLVIRRSRPWRVLFGGTVAMFGMFIGSGVALYCTQAWTMKDAPEDVTVDQLIANGLGENRLVRLTGIQLSRVPEPSGLVGGGEAYNLDRRGRIVMRADDSTVSAARMELQQTGGLVGVVSRDELVHRMFDVLTTCGADLSKVPQLQSMKRLDNYPYVVRPIDTADIAFTNRKQKAQQFLAIACGATAVGLVIAGSGGVGIISWILFTIPVVFCVPGTFLRYGRGNLFTRMLYFVSGVALIGGGYYFTFFEDKIASPTTDPLFAPLGFLLASFGAAAVLGAMVNQWGGGTKATAANMDTALKTRSTPNSKTAQVLQEAAQRSGTKVAPGLRLEQPVTRYQDPHFMIAAESSVAEPMALLATGFEALDFEAPLVLDVGDAEDSEKQTMQVGCRNLVLAVNTTATGDADTSSAPQTQTRLFSVLDSGQVVVTLSAGTPARADERKHSGGIVVLAKSADPSKLLSAHLENTVAAAEVAGTSICSLHPGEWRDVYAYGHRVLADVGHQNGDNSYKVFPSTHGRFQFPVQPVEELQTVG